MEQHTAHHAIHYIQYVVEYQRYRTHDSYQTTGMIMDITPSLHTTSGEYAYNILVGTYYVGKVLFYARC